MNNNTFKYILDNNHEENFNTPIRILKQEYYKHYFVSTVFLGISHDLGGSSSELFETMVFSRRTGKPFDDYTRRYSTWDQAMAGHVEVLKELGGKNVK